MNYKPILPNNGWADLIIEERFGSAPTWELDRTGPGERPLTQHNNAKLYIAKKYAQEAIQDHNIRQLIQKGYDNTGRLVKKDYDVTNMLHDQIYQGKNEGVIPVSLVVRIAKKLLK